MVKLTHEERNLKGSPMWKLPHHPIINPRKPDKIRVVFVCAANYQVWSLNKWLLSGYNVVHDIVNISLRFRERYKALAADIKKMFLQVSFTKSDGGGLSFFLWTDGDVTATPDEYEMGVHLYEATSSPLCADCTSKSSRFRQFKLRRNS